MRTRSITIAAAAAACVLFAAASPSPQDPVQHRAAYGDLLAGYIGKGFNLSADRSLAVRNDKGACKLAAVGQDYVTFESDTSRVSIPLAVLRIETDK